MQLFREQIEVVYQQGLEAVVALVGELQNALKAQQEQIEAFQRHRATLEARLVEVEARLKQNSQNSSRPPSSDWMRKPPSGKASGGAKPKRPPGGQQGHPGHQLEMVATPDHVICHAPASCAYCAADLSGSAVVSEQRRQVVDLPPIQLEVTEHRALEKRCAFCGHRTWGHFPEGVKARIQYGAGLQALVLYLSTYQLLPYDRLRQALADLTGHRLSTGTLAEMVDEGAEALLPCCQQIQEAVAASEIVHGDETGIYVKGELFWLHVASTAKATFYGLMQKRGKEAMDALGVLPRVKGIMVHDGLSSYQHYDGCRHALCNAHHLRELQAAEEQGFVWARRMKKLLLKMKRAVDEARAAGAGKPSEDVIAYFKGKYERQLVRAYREMGPPPRETIRRVLDDGTVEILVREVRKKSKAYNLLLRLDERRDQVLRFLEEEWVPFDNNQAERDLRMAKLKQKISGGFRSVAGGEAFCRLRSYVSTIRKQGKQVLLALQAAVEGQARSCLPT